VQSNVFFAKALASAEYLAKLPPYAPYSNHLNAYAIFVPSAQSGSDHPNQGILVDTYFNSTYDSYGSTPLLTIPPNDRDSNPANGRDKVDALIRQLLPEASIKILLVNDSLFGASASGPGSVAIASTSANLYDYRDTIAHETGHTFAGLADEYEAPSTYTAPEEPNVTRVTNRNTIKWKAWIAPSTPLPTPETDVYANVVGAFEGARYQPKGWFRPRLDCKMRNVRQPYCEICSEAIVLNIHKLIRPIEQLSPSTNTVVTNATTLSAEWKPFGSVTPRWLLNGTALTNQTGQSLDVSSLRLAPGSYSVRLQLDDSTPLVRTDPTGLTKRSVAWNLLVPAVVVPPRLTASIEGGSLVLRGVGSTSGWVVEYSTNLTQWVTISSSGNGSGELYRTPLSGSGAAYFRLKRQN
jgi:hypothetical protein